MALRATTLGVVPCFPGTVVLRYLFGLLLIGLIFVFLAWRFDLAAAARTIADVNPLWLAAALPAFGLSKLIHTLRWRLLLPQRLAPPLAPMFGIFLLANLVNAVLPLRAGDAGRVQMTAARYKIPRSELASSIVVVETLLDGLAFVVLLGLALALGSAPGLAVGIFVALGAAVSGAIALGALLARRPLAEHGLVSRSLGLLQPGLSLLASPRHLVAASLLSLGGWLLEALAYLFLGEAFGLDLAPESYLAITVAANLLTAVPLTPLGFGVYELGVQGLVAALGAPAEEALAYAVGSHLLFQLWVVAAGIVSAYLLKLRLSEVFYLRKPDG